MDKELPKLTILDRVAVIFYDIQQAASDIIMILRHHCKYDRVFILGRRRKAWYTLKALLCTIIGLIIPVVFRGHDFYSDNPDDYIVVAITDGGGWFDGEYSGNWWLELRVGYGIFRNWWVYESDASN